MNDQERACCAATAALSHAARGWGHLGVALGLMAALLLALLSAIAPRGLPVATIAGWALAAMLLAPERYLALRLAFDARLFDALAHGQIASLQALDAALLQLGVRKPADALRPLADRISGTMTLLKRHGALVICQSVAFLIALLAHGLR